MRARKLNLWQIVPPRQISINLKPSTAQTVKYGAFSCKIEYLEQVADILNVKGHPNHIIGSKVTTLLLNGWILPSGEVT